MSDTQWPRWEVFKQDTPQKPHQAVGSVHATDAEHALFNARAVFARRPNAISMWVAPASAIFEMTAEELADNPAWDKEDVPAGAASASYLVFCKLSHRQSLTYVDHLGEVEAVTSRQALKKAIATFNKSNKPTLAWWVMPQRAVAKSRKEDVPSWFEAAKSKTYKQQSEYGMTSAKKQRGKS